ncbi:Hsp20/alpha crystallin family protein [Arthrobacter sp. StoSoilB5]|uniref:Hsp20 family protein n=1 Tax=Arthrobacter sp. StoSoilB5 TaxID=2830992 RepID=UPI001CC48FA1
MRRGPVGCVYGGLSTLDARSPLNNPLPDGVKETDVTASYKDGVLEVRAPIPEQVPATSTSRIPITRE